MVRTRSDQPDEPPIKAGVITRPTAGTKETKNSTQRASAKPPPPRATKPARKPRAASTEPEGGPSAKEPQGNEPATDVLPPPVPSYHPRVVVRSNNILLSGAWTVRKYSNDFENDKERLELDRLKATVASRAAIREPNRRELEKSPSLEDFEEPGRKNQPLRDEGGHTQEHPHSQPVSDKGKTALYRINGDHRFAVKHKDHGGGIFDPRVEDFDPMPNDRHHFSGQYSDTFTKEDGTYTWGNVGPQTGMTGGWHFLRSSGADADNVRARNLMGLKGFFEPDTLDPTASNIAAYREYLWAYKDVDPKVDNVTDSINIVWKEHGPDPHGLSDRSGDQIDPADEGQDDDEPGSDRGTDVLNGEPNNGRGGFSFSGKAGDTRSQQARGNRKESGGVSPLSTPLNGQEEILSTSIGDKAADKAQNPHASKVDTASKKRKSQADAAQQLDVTAAGGAEKPHPPKKARHTDHGCHSGEAKDIPIVDGKSAEKARRVTFGDRKSLTDQAKKKGGHGNMDAHRKSEGTSGLLSTAEFEALYERSGFK